MTQLKVSKQTYGEIYHLLEREGRTINDGKPITLEKGDAFMPPWDFRLAALRQNCLEAAAMSYTPPHRATDNGDMLNYNNTDEFTSHCEKIFQWCLKGKQETETLADTKTEPKPKPAKGW